MNTTPFQDWEATVLARVRRMGLSASVRGEHSERTIDVADKDGSHRFHVLMRPKDGGFVAGIVRPEDHTLQGLPHATGSRGVLQEIDNRIAYVGPEFPYGGEKLVTILGFEIDRCLEPRPAVDPGSPEEASQAADKLVDLASGDPETAKIALAGALAEVLSPGTLKTFIEALDRHVDAVPAPRFG